MRRVFYTDWYHPQIDNFWGWLKKYDIIKNIYRMFHSSLNTIICSFPGPKYKRNLARNTECTLHIERTKHKCEWKASWFSKADPAAWPKGACNWM